MRKVIKLFKLRVCPNRQRMSINNNFYVYLGFLSLNRNEVKSFHNLATMISNGFVNYQVLLCAELVHDETLRAK